MTDTKQYLNSQYAIARCKKLLEVELSDQDESMVTVLIKILDRRELVTTYQQGIIQNLEAKYNLVPVEPPNPKINYEINILYISNPIEFPPRVIGWGVGEIFDADAIYKLAVDFASKMKVPTPKVAYVLRNDVFFEIE